MTSLFQLPNLPNDMPPELRDRLILQAKIDHILKTSGIADLTQLENDLSALKLQLNNVLSQVLGLEHNMDNVHNYDDTSVKSQLATALTMAQNAQADVGTMQSRVNVLEGTSATATGDISTLQGKTAAIAGSAASTTIHPTSSVGLSTKAANNHGTSIDLLPGYLTLAQQADNGSGTDFINQIQLGNGSTDGGITLGSGNSISLYQSQNPGAGLTIGSDGVVSIAGTRIVVSSTGIDFVGTGTNANKHVKLTWTAV
jgi:hypothetical protein